MKTIGQTIAIATVAFAAAAFAAQAQTTPAPATTPASKAPAAKTMPKKAPAAATTSQCKGLVQAACTAKAAECTWIAAAKTKKGKEIKAYCRSKPKKKS